MGLPTGRLTLLFTDIEGSTRLLERLGDRYAGVLGDHDDIIRSAVARHRGHVVDTQGDASFAVFTSPAAAVDAAVAVQRGLASHPWPDGIDVRVRMGLHEGEPTLIGDDYVGMAVHECARICSAAHGGQVLASTDTLASLPGPERSGVRIEQLGDHVLKDIPEPLALGQLLIDGLPDRFPPLRSLGTPTNLTPAPTAIIGRDAEIASIVTTLHGEQPRLVTLVGPGGTGKTRLAQEVARAALPHRPSGVFFVSLAPVAEADLIFTAIGDALDLRDAAGRPDQHPAVEYLRTRGALLVLDNLEHLEQAAEPVTVLLDRCPGLTILATSRTPLRLRAERRWPVAPLPVGDPGHPGPAVELFVQRAREVDPAFQPTGDEYDAVIALCRRLDGQPLAIELAAARAGMLPPSAMCERLDGSLALLSRSARDVPERHRTLHAAIAWSYDLLDAPERRLLERLAVMPGGWTLDAAEALSADLADTDPLDGVQALIDASLAAPRASRTETPRFGMLETVREFALERLGRRDGDDQEARRRLAEFLAEMLHAHVWEFHGRDQKAAFRRTDDDLDNIRASMAWTRRSGQAETQLRIAASAWYFMEVRGALAEAREWLESALAATTGTSSDRVLALCGVCILAAMQGRAEEVREHEAELERLEPGIDTPIYRVRATMALGLMASDRGDLEETRRRFRRSAEMARGLSDDLAAISLNNLGDAAMRDGRLDEATAVLTEALDVSRGAGNAHGTVLGNLAMVHIARHRFTAAEATLEEGLAVSLEAEDRLGVIGAIHGLGCLAAHEEPERAARLLAWVDGEWERMGMMVQGLEAMVDAEARQRIDSALGTDARRAFADQGRRMTDTDAVNYARGEGAAALIAAL